MNYFQEFRKNNFSTYKLLVISTHKFSVRLSESTKENYEGTEEDSFTN